MEKSKTKLNIDFVLVSPKLPQNVGAAARAIKTMGFRQLVLVGGCNPNDIRAKWLAVGSEDILENTIQIDNFESIKNNYDLIIGTTAKKRKHSNLLIHADELQNIILSKKNLISNVAVLFGNESYGLNNKQLSYCDFLSTIPTKLSYPSLNLAQTIMLYAYILSDLTNNIGVKNSSVSGNYSELKEKLSLLFDLIDIQKNEPICQRIFENISLLDEKEIKLIHFLNKKIINKITTDKKIK